MQQPVSSEGQEIISPPRVVKEEENEIRSKYFKAALQIGKILVGLGLLILSVQGIQWQQLADGLQTTKLEWLALAILSVIAGLGIKLWRWTLIVRYYHIQAGFSRLFSAYFIGQATNIVLPLRGGEVVRLGYITGNARMIPQAATTIVLEKYLDLVALTLCGVIVSLKISMDNILNLKGLLLPVTIGVSILLAGFIFLGPKVWEKIRESRQVPKGMTGWIDRWMQANLWLRSPKQVLPSILLTATIWGVMWATNLLVFKSLGLPLGGTAAGLVLVLVYIGLLPALMPGNLGPFYFFARLALIPFGVIYGPAIVFAIILHAIVTLPPLLGGVIGLLIHSERPSLA